MIPLSDSAPSHRFPLVTYTLIVVNVVVFVEELLSLDVEGFILHYGLVPGAVSFLEPGSLFPFVTSMFLHAGLVHLVSNLWFLRIFGDSVEAALGWVKFLGFYLISGVIANFTQYVFTPSSTIPMVGASGAVAGVLGAYLVFYPRHRIRTLIPVWGFWDVVELPASVMLLYWFLIQLLSGVATLGVAMATGGIAFFAHVGGFLFGYLASSSLRGKFLVSV